jgi:hypothetical protein
MPHPDHPNEEAHIRGREWKCPRKTGTPTGTGIRKCRHCRGLRDASHYGSMSEADRTLIEAIREALHSARDPVKAGPMQAYIKSAMPLLGVQKPEQVKVLNPVLQAHPLPDAKTWRATVLTTFREATYREEWSAALAILGWRRYQPWLNSDALPLCETLIVEGAWEYSPHDGPNGDFPFGPVGVGAVDRRTES